MSKYNFFDRVSVSTTNFDNHVVYWTFNSTGIVLVNETETSGRIVEYSFNGTDVHGDLDPDLATSGLAFDNRRETRIWFRLKTAGGAASVRIETWA
jgi:hypothetical protein